MKRRLLDTTKENILNNLHTISIFYNQIKLVIIKQGSFDLIECEKEFKLHEAIFAPIRFLIIGNIIFDLDVTYNFLLIPCFVILPQGFIGITQEYEEHTLKRILKEYNRVTKSRKKILSYIDNINIDYLFKNGILTEIENDE